MDEKHPRGRAKIRRFFGSLTDTSANSINYLMKIISTAVGSVKYISKNYDISGGHLSFYNFLKTGCNPLN